MFNTKEIIDTVTQIDKLQIKLRQLVLDATQTKILPAFPTPELKATRKKPYSRWMKHYTKEEDQLILNRALKPRKLAIMLDRTAKAISIRRTALTKLQAKSRNSMPPTLQVTQHIHQAPSSSPATLHVG